MKKTIYPLMLVAALAVTVAACDKSAAPEQSKSATVAPVTAPVVSNDLSQETGAYKKWVEGQIDGLVGDTQKFVDALNAGDVVLAKKLYAPTRMYFERSEPIAESFGDLDPRIDNREADLEKGEKWTGFHPIEKLLWTKNTTKGSEVLATQLLNDVKE